MFLKITVWNSSEKFQSFPTPLSNVEKSYSPVPVPRGFRGGDAYPGMIRKTEKKPIRGFFQEGINDLDNEHGNWPLGNMAMEAALKFKGYDHKYVWGHGEHSGKQMGTVFPEAMRWLWRR